MKLPSFLALAFAAGIASVNAQIVVDLTGSTAGRASVHEAIKSVLTNVTYGFVGSDINKTGQAIFKGTYDNTSYVVRTSWSGSATGLSALSSGVDVNYLPVSSNVSSVGVTNLANGTDPSASEVAFSDVFVGSTTVPSTGLQNTNTFVIPFKWIASNRAQSLTGLTNITPVQARALLVLGELPASILTGNDADSSVTLLATGRDNGSGTRITTLADIGYGVNTQVTQYKPTIVGNDIVGDVYGEFDKGLNDGFVSGGDLAKVLNKQSVNDTADFIYVSYLGISDADGTALVGAYPAKELTYNGVAYSPENVYQGKYSLWGYLHLYYKTTLTDAMGKKFANSLADKLKLLPGSSGLNPNNMKVYRDTDGGNIYHK